MNKSNVAPLLIQDTEIDWERYVLTDVDLARVVDTKTLVQRVIELRDGVGMHDGIPLPWNGMADKVRLTAGKLSLWAGINHHGKTAMLKQLALHWIRSGQHVCMASMEEFPEVTMLDVVHAAMPNEQASNDAIDVVCHWASGKLWLYDNQKMMTTQRMLALIGYAAKEKNCKHFILDSLMRLGLGQDDYEGQRVFVNHLTNYARQLGIHIHLVHHIVKEDESQVPGRDKIRGTGAITDQADHVFIVWRDMREQRGIEDPDGILVVAKNRGRPNWIGRIKLWRHASGQFLRGRFDQPMQFIA
jgi:twinkle protein